MFKLIAVDDIFQVLEDNQTAISAMKASRYYHYYLYNIPFASIIYLITLSFQIYSTIFKWGQFLGKKFNPHIRRSGRLFKCPKAIPLSWGLWVYSEWFMTYLPMFYIIMSMWTKFKFLIIVWRNILEGWLKMV